MIRYANLIIDKERLYRCWVSGACEHTSVISLDELLEQVFDDLDADKIMADASSSNALSRELHFAMNEFISSLKMVEDEQGDGNSRLSPEEILKSRYWMKTISSGEELLKAAQVDGYNTIP